ncbi:hypothetical protein P7K49_006581, partial [Saguinus oedipus]
MNFYKHQKTIGAGTDVVGEEYESPLWRQDGIVAEDPITTSTSQSVGIHPEEGNR